MKIKSLYVFVLIAFSGTAAIGSQKETVECPGKITADDVVHLRESASGWRVNIRSELKDVSDSLYESRFFSGPPEEMVELLPDDSHDHTEIWSYLYKDAFNKRPIWIGCYYKKKTTELFKQVQFQPDKCSVFVKQETQSSNMEVLYTCTK